MRLFCSGGKHPAQAARLDEVPKSMQSILKNTFNIYALLESIFTMARSLQRTFEYISGTVYATSS